jgi:hypothetical protein
MVGVAVIGLGVYGEVHARTYASTALAAGAPVDIDWNPFDTSMAGV